MEYKKAKELETLIYKTIQMNDFECPEVTETGMEEISDWIDQYVKEMKK